MIWKFHTGGEIGTSGVLSSDSRVFYVGSRQSPCAEAARFVFFRNSPIAEIATYTR
jgi:hypothetical protein